MATTHLLTAEDLLKMPDDGHRYELVRGELREMPLAGHVHGEIALSIGAELRQFVKQHRLGKTYAAETGFKVATNPDHVLAADAAFVRQGRTENVRESTGFWPGAPDLAVEVISPRDTYSDVAEKALDWLQAGTRMVLVVDPRCETVTVYRSASNIVVLSEDDAIDGADVVPGWKLPVREIFST